MGKRETLAWVYEGYAGQPEFSALDQSMFVPGAGPEQPRAILVGEGPGRTEAEQGLPFVGRSGARLNKYLAEVGLLRGDCWVTNVMKFRCTGPDGRDRPPGGHEVGASMPYLWRELEVVGAGTCRVICALGAVAARALQQREVHLTRARGTWRIISDPVGSRWAVFTTYHPAAALRNPVADKALRADLAAFRDQVERFGQAAAGALR